MVSWDFIERLLETMIWLYHLLRRQAGKTTNSLIIDQGTLIPRLINGSQKTAHQPVGFISEIFRDIVDV